MRYVKGECRKCGATIKIDIGTMTPEEARKKLERTQGFECPGHHVELSGPLDYWDVDWNVVDEDGTRQPTEEEWLAEKREKYERVVEAKDLDSVVDEVVAFAMGLCVVVRNGEKEFVDFQNSPSGRRYYLIGRKGAVHIPVSEGV